MVEDFFKKWLWLVEGVIERQYLLLKSVTNCTLNFIFMFSVEVSRKKIQ